jgi:putative hydrolase of the HAD superfamily
VTDDLLAGITAVVFDFFGTLTPVSPPLRWAANAAGIAEVMGVPPPDLTAALDTSFPERISGALGDVRSTMRELARRLGVELTEDQLTDVARRRREIQEAMFALRPEALPVIAELRARGLKIGLLSDCTSELPDAWPGLPLAPVVDAPVFSCVERTRKPDPRLFRTVAANLSAAPAEVLYVGDGGGNELTGASAAGMRAVLLAGPDWHSHSATEHWHREQDWTGPRISSLTELVPSISP